VFGDILDSISESGGGKIGDLAEQTKFGCRPGAPSDQLGNDSCGAIPGTVVQFEGREPASFGQER
jgi:hypothetical protein